ncbi:MAG: hypothetical protein A3F68_10590 [Acidobacteria bacterium RIFCSPLOWO2_12_FULL_54_10]|nr:MAG: hypothetical protein A3F68_10590 [Acidobacteria bacterium RIFCSPLOWO2_12_FULL_54_10]
MAVVAPLKALRYDLRKTGGAETIFTQPYDKITPQMQKEYLSRSPYNLAHIIKGESRSTDTQQDNVYTRAATSFRDWVAKGVLARQDKPAFYAYFQEFTAPGDAAGKKIVRKSFLGLGKLEDYDSHVIYRHEQTLSGPKVDRLELLRATRTHFEPIFLLYSNAEKRIEAVLNQHAAKPPEVEVKDEYGVTHRLWEINELENIKAIQQAMQEKKLIIADGHHRYETALNFRREYKAAHPDSSNQSCDFAIMAFVNMDSEGIIILPTHRLIANVPNFNGPAFLAQASRYFRCREYPFSPSEDISAVSARLRKEMVSATGTPTIGVLFGDQASFFLLQWRQDVEKAPLMPDLLPVERELEVVLLHRILLANCLGMDDESVRNERFLTYVRAMEEGVKSVVEGSSQACFFLNHIGIDQIRDIAQAGRLMPQKSTDFYPKLLSGLVIFPLED